jgi:hypothetical protein
MSPGPDTAHDQAMPTFLLHHHHEPGDCRVAYAAWKGVTSPLRGTLATSSCASGSHAIWWLLEASDEGRALAQLPAYVAERTAVVRVDEVRIP